MNQKQLKLVTGSLLHDIGKAVYRSGDRRTHSESGADFLKNTAKINDQEILNCVLFHHGKALRSAHIADDSCAYLTYFADNIAAAADRRQKDIPEEGFDKEVPLESIFNILNGNNASAHYRQAVLDPDSGINYPTEEPVQLDSSFYKRINDNIADCLKGLEWSREYVNSLLTVLEANLSYIPSSTSRREMSDISLYDHMKLTAALAACMESFFDAAGETDYRSQVLDKADETYERKMFWLYSLDISGIQSFIYTISSEGALKGLRARSFYLELLMEHIVDGLLEELGFCRANLIYCGGGHCYLLLANTAQAKNKVSEYVKETNEWFMKNFGTALYIAGGGAQCSANDLKNIPEGSYEALYRQISEEISASKAHRYSWEDIKRLNSEKPHGERECRICRRTDALDEKDRCSICAALENFSSDVLYRNFFVVTEGTKEKALPLPGGYSLEAFTDEKSLRKRMDEPGYIRCYTKNRDYTGKLLSTHLWAGCYTSKDTFEEFALKAKQAGAIERIGILRADVDNLGAAFAGGFKREGSSRNMTITRTAALSRALSLFFKCHINRILEDMKADAAIVYSGGDDIFLVGAWNQIIDIFIALKEAFEKFTLGSLSISGGIGMYVPGYPVHVMAGETQRLEEAAKAVEGKNAVCLFEAAIRYSWDEFMDKVLEEKYKIIKTFFDSTKDYGKAFLYHLLELIRNSSEKINLVRLIYLLSRMEPGAETTESAKAAYREFSRHMHRWIVNEKDRSELMTAIYLYVYLTREKGREE